MKIQNIKIFLAIILTITFCKVRGQSIVDNNFKIAELQYAEMLKIIGKSTKNPGYTDKKGRLKLVNSNNWISGFFPGCLWDIYNYTRDDKWKKSAEFFTENEEAEQYNSTTHDIGFKMFCSYGMGYKLTGDKHYKNVLLQSARTLSTRFNPKVGCICSWDHHKNQWEYPVIIDNMMNLELLFWATQVSGDSSYYKIAVSHADTTMKNHFRNDYSTWHVVNYDTITGRVINKQTHQGYSDCSCWARGEA